MRCPNCGSTEGFETRADYRTCSETGYTQGSWLECLACHAPTDESELQRIAHPEGVQIFVKDDRIMASGFGPDFSPEDYTELAMDFDALGPAARWAGFRWVDGCYEFGKGV